MAAEMATSTTVVAICGMPNAFLNAVVTEFATTWLIPAQQSRPERANAMPNNVYLQPLL